MTKRAMTPLGAQADAGGSKAALLAGTAALATSATFAAFAAPAPAFAAPASAFMAPAPAFATPALAFAVPASAVPTPTSASVQEVHRLSGREVAVYNLAGDVKVVAGEGPDVVVEVTRGGSDGRQLRVETGRIGGRESLRIVYPDDRIVYRRMGRSTTTVNVRSDGSFLGGRRGGRRVRISGRGGGTEAHADLLVRLPRGGTAAVRLAAGRARAEDVVGDVEFDTRSGHVDVADVTGDVDVDAGSGHVRISGVEGVVTADTGSGSIELADISGAALTADTGSGRVEGRDVAVERLLVDTGSGHVRFDGLAATDVECDTGSGSVRLAMLSDVDRMVVDTGSGGVLVEVPDDFGAQVELDTGAGRIDVEVPARVSLSKRGHFRGAVGDGSGTVAIDTGAGGITIRRQ